MDIPNFFKYCPWCCSPEISLQKNKRVFCTTCGREYFHNVAAAAGALLRYQDKILLVQRNRDPAKGKLHIPGGFVDPGETAEDAARREINEELHLRLETIRYFSSFSNQYEYKGVFYYTCDIIFLATINAVPQTFCAQEIAGIRLLHPGKIEPESLAFSSTTAIINAYRRYLRNPG